MVLRVVKVLLEALVLKGQPILEHKELQEIQEHKERLEALVLKGQPILEHKELLVKLELKEQLAHKD